MARLCGVELISAAVSGGTTRDGVPRDGCVHAKLVKWDKLKGKLPAWGEAKKEIMVALAGALAARLEGGSTRFSSFLLGGRGDYHLARRVLDLYFPDRRAGERAETELRIETERRLADNWIAVEAVAHRLMRGGTVPGEELVKLMAKAATGD